MQKGRAIIRAALFAFSIHPQTNRRRLRNLRALQQLNNARVLRFQNLKIAALSVAINPACHEQQREHRQQNGDVDFDNDLAWAAPARLAPV